MAGKGGRRPGSGRKSGQPNKATAEIKAMACCYAPEALAELARLATKAESEQARVSAIKEILDRAYGKSPQPHDGDGQGGAIKIEDATPAKRKAAVALLLARA